MRKMMFYGLLNCLLGLGSTALQANSYQQPNPSTDEVNFTCAADMPAESCEAMKKLNSQQKIVEKSQGAVLAQYCDGTLDAQACDRRRQEAIRQKCVTPDYVEFLKHVPVVGGMGVAPACLVSYNANDQEYKYLVAFCKCGCFDKNTDILTSIGEGEEWTNVVDLFNSQKREVVGLTADSVIGEELVLENREFAPLRGPADSKVWVTMQLSNGKKLKLTSDHAVLLADGYLKSASELKTGDMLFGPSNNLVKIETLTVGLEAIETFNLGISSKSDNPLDHIFFGNGVAIGDDSFQNGLDELVNRANLR